VALGGGRQSIGILFGIAATSLFSLMYLLLVLLPRIVTLVVLRRPPGRSSWLASATVLLVFGLLAVAQVSAQAPSATLLVFGFVSGVLVAGVILVLLSRFGLLALAACFSMLNLFTLYPVTLDVNAPYFPSSLVALVAAGALAVTAFRIALAGRPLFQDLVLEPQSEQ
jgi:hypothetical protein